MGLSGTGEWRRDRDSNPGRLRHPSRFSQLNQSVPRAVTKIYAPILGVTELKMTKTVDDFLDDEQVQEMLTDMLRRLDKVIGDAQLILGTCI